MNTEDLHVALQQSFSPDANLRDPAEKMIKSLKYVDGATSMLLQIAAEKKVIIFLCKPRLLNLPLILLLFTTF